MDFKTFVLFFINFSITCTDDDDLLKMEELVLQKSCEIHRLLQSVILPIHEHSSVILICFPII